MIKTWTLNNSIDDLMFGREIQDCEEMQIRREDTGKIVWEGKGKEYKKLKWCQLEALVKKSIPK